MNMDIKSN